MRAGAVTLVGLGLLTAASYGIDFTAAALGAGWFGASRRVMAAAGVKVGVAFLVIGIFLAAFFLS